MSRYQQMFAQLAERGAGALVPFVMLGDPTPGASLDIITALVDAGADALELGIPFSDPTADGPVVQAAAQRALASGTTPATAMRLINEIRARHPRIPLGVLTYANLVVRRGLPSFYGALADGGADSLLVADVPSVEIAPFAAAAREAGIAQVMIVPPAASTRTLAAVAGIGSGYSYVLGRAGVTGADIAMQPPPAELFAALRTHGAAPALVGFGISTPEHVRAAIHAGAAGAICGSAIVRIIARHAGSITSGLDEMHAFTQALADAAHAPGGAHRG